MKILVTYCNYTGTTANYLVAALRRAGVEITTVGENCEVHTGRNNPYDTIYRLITEAKYDLVFEIESGGFELYWVPDHSKMNGVPVIWYALDTHVNTQHHLNRYNRYKLMFLCHKQYQNLFTNSIWLPVACDVDIHKGNFHSEKLYDITFVGNYGDGAHNTRTHFLRKLSSCFKLNVKKNLWNKDVTNEYEKSHILFNCSLAGDLNMRVFECLASGGMLVTDDVVDAHNFFVDGTHLKFYRDENQLVHIISEMLQNPQSRQEIALTGQLKVLNKHTYDNRVTEIVLPGIAKVL